MEIQYHKLGGLQQPKFIFTQFGKPEIPSEMLVPSAGSESEHTPHLFPSFWQMLDNSGLITPICLHSYSTFFVSEIYLS